MHVRVRISTKSHLEGCTRLDMLCIFVTVRVHLCTYVRVNRAYVHILKRREPTSNVASPADRKASPVALSWSPASRIYHMILWHKCSRSEGRAFWQNFALVECQFTVDCQPRTEYSFPKRWTSQQPNPSLRHWFSGLQAVQEVCAARRLVGSVQGLVRYSFVRGANKGRKAAASTRKLLQGRNDQRLEPGICTADVPSATLIGDVATTNARFCFHIME